ncbi:hypothetical protein X733_32700 [Mesorhizobium sp. L2C067A000]|nr:hypothetical protein X733_32700 [Mesorhizobium sp. L2C067A000]
MVCHTSERPSVLAFIRLPCQLIQLITTILRQKAAIQSVSIQAISMR